MELGSRISSKAAKQTPVEMSRHETSRTNVKVTNKERTTSEGLRKLDKFVWKKLMHNRFSAFYSLRLHESL